MIKILEHERSVPSGKVYNIGNPANTISISELATKALHAASPIPEYKTEISKLRIVSCPAEEYYGKGYQDMDHRVPNIARTGGSLG